MVLLKKYRKHPIGVPIVAMQNKKKDFIAEEFGRRIAVFGIFAPDFRFNDSESRKRCSGILRQRRAEAWYLEVHLH